MNRQLTMLIVDDMEVNRVSFAEIFKDEYQILEAENGKQAMIFRFSFIRPYTHVDFFTLAKPERKPSATRRPKRPEDLRSAVRLRRYNRKFSVR